MVLVLLIVYLGCTSAATCKTEPAHEKPPPPNPVPEIKCGLNEKPVPCKTLCPPQSCNISYTSNACVGEKKCIPGCDCIDNYLRNNDNVCIFNENCPPAPGSEEPPKDGTNNPPVTEPLPPSKPPKKPSGSTISSNSKSTSYAESMASSSSSTFSSSSSSSSSTQSSASSRSLSSSQVTEGPIPPKKPSGSTKYSSSVATSSSSAHSSSSSSSSSSQSQASYSSSSSSQVTGGGTQLDCTYQKCTPTCNFQYPKDCPYDSNPCNCPAGSIISDKGGKCVPRTECDKYINCNGDYNRTYVNCPIACPSTCDKPNAEYCDVPCDSTTCACKAGYILREKNGPCIKVADCPGGVPCAKNETFAYCGVECPNNYCPTSDSRGIIACDPPYPCPSRCVCLGGYRRKSNKEKICILASDCPPVKCTRLNEEWSSCPGRCFSDYCRDRNKKLDCSFYGPDCNPQCVCKKGFYRNGEDICVKEEECPAEG